MFHAPYLELSIGKNLHGGDVESESLELILTIPAISPGNRKAMFLICIRLLGSVLFVLGGPRVL